MAVPSVLARTSRVFANVQSTTLTRHVIDSPPIGLLIRASSRLFSILDRSDLVQAEVSRRLWVLRSSILFTFLPFEDNALDLRRQVVELTQASIGLPEAGHFIQALKSAVEDIINGGHNPKRERVLRMLDARSQPSEMEIGVLSALSGGRTPGWPHLQDSAEIRQLADRASLIHSRRDLGVNIFETVILPCACRNVAPDLLSEILYSGRSMNFDVLLYHGEIFHIPKRLVLPDEGILMSRRQSTVIEQDKWDVPKDDSATTVETWMNEAFWQGLHGGARSGAADLISANYVLFCDGTGTFLPEDGRVPTLPVDGVLTDESDLRIVSVTDVADGDLMILKSGESGILLDEASDRIMNQSGDTSLIDRATDWKQALEALLISHSCEEVAQALQQRGMRTTAASIHQWSGPDVLGPGNEQVFKQLIRLLADKGKIDKVGEDLSSYAARRWDDLQNLRGVRHKAGNLIRQDLFKALFGRFGRANHRLGDRESVHIDGDIGVELLILRVSAVDRNPAYVHFSRLCRLDNLKGNKWLG